MNRFHAEKYLMQQLSVLEAGQPLPSIRVMQESTGFGRKTLERALQVIAQENLIERRPRQGFFRTTKPVSSTKNLSVIDVIFTSGPEQLVGFFSELMDSLNMRATQRGYSIRSHFMSSSNRAKECQALLSSTLVNGCLMIAQHDSVVSSILDENHIPWVAVLPNVIMNRNMAIYDNPDMIKIQLEHLLSLGHRKIALFMSGSEDPASHSITHQRRLTDYYKIMAERGHRVQPEWVAWIDNTEKSFFNAIEKVFACDEQPTAAIVNDTNIPAIYRFIEGRGMKIGKDFSVIATDELNFIASISPGVTTVRNSRIDIADSAIEILEGSLSGKTIDAPQYTKLELIIRESTGPCR